MLFVNAYSIYLEGTLFSQISLWGGGIDSQKHNKWGPYLSSFSRSFFSVVNHLIATANSIGGHNVLFDIFVFFLHGPLTPMLFESPTDVTIFCYHEARVVRNGLLGGGQTPGWNSSSELFVKSPKICFFKTIEFC